MDRLLIDTNIILDYLLTRTPFYEAADKLIQECMKGTVRSCIAAHSFPNMFYILRKDFTVEERKKGYWINDKGLYRCSRCNQLWAEWWAAAKPIERMKKEVPFCPMCGADMRGV